MLLEILMALVIFTTVVLAWLQATDRALNSAFDANNDRILRMLTQRKLEEVRARPRAFVDGDEGGFSESVAPGEANPFEEYAWSVEAVEVVAAGYSADAEAEFLFPRDEEGGPPTAPEGSSDKPPDAVVLTRFTVVVRWVEGEVSMRAVTYLPIRIEEEAEAESAR